MKNDGGAAFARAAQSMGSRAADAQDGMTLHQWFAGQALAGMYSNPRMLPFIRGKEDAVYKRLADGCLEQADAMIEAYNARMKEGEKAHESKS